MKGGDIMCCHTNRHHGFQRRGPQMVCDCGCDEPPYARPRFMTKKQRIEALERHLADLQEEVKAVKEHIAHIKKET